MTRERILGIDQGTTGPRAHLVRAAIEGIASRVVQVVRAMERDSGLSIRRLRADGGLTNSAILMQAEADLLGVPIEVPAESEAMVAGVCYSAARASGLWRSDADIAARARPARIFEPRIAENVRIERLARFERALDRVKDWS